MQRLPGLARREGNVLTVALYPTGSTTFTDVDDPINGRSYSLWDSLDPINAVVLYTTTNDATSFTLLQRRTNRRFTLPAEPVLSPDRQRLVTADICPKHCSNEIAVWRISDDGLRKELAWSPAAAGSTPRRMERRRHTEHRLLRRPDKQSDAKLDRKLTDPTWTRLPPTLSVARERVAA